MELLASLTEGNVITFLLLLMRFTGVLTFFPFFENQLIPLSIRGALIFFLTLIFFPLVPVQNPPTYMMEFIIAGLGELLLGFLASVILQIIFGMLSFGGEIISFAMGLTMASAYDPSSGQQRPIVAQLILLLGLMVLLSLDLHHYFFLFIAQSLQQLPLGGLILTPHIMEYILKAFGNLFFMGFTIAFPIVALILLSDIIFGMIMKTHPQFNLLVIGFPVKIAVAIVVLIVVLPAIMLRFQTEFKKALEALPIFFQ